MIVGEYNANDLIRCNHADEYNVAEMNLGGGRLRM